MPLIYLSIAAGKLEQYRLVQMTESHSIRPSAPYITLVFHIFWSVSTKRRKTVAAPRMPWCSSFPIHSGHTSACAPNGFEAHPTSINMVVSTEYSFGVDLVPEGKRKRKRK